LPEIGASGQARIEAARVLVVGAGGLGCVVLPYLCAAGIGSVVIVDPDCVDETNLHRQPLYRMSDLGLPKAQCAAEHLRALNPNVAIEPLCGRLTPINVDDLVSHADVVVDCADSFAATYILSDSCMRGGVPLVSASVLGLSGYAGVFCGPAPSYRAVFPELPSQARSCATAGVLGSAVAMVGALQAQLTLSLILKLSPSVSGRLISVDCRTLRFGGFSFADARESTDPPPLRFIDPSQIESTDVVVDLRSAASGIESLSAQGSQRIVLCCRSGVRAWTAANRLRSQGHSNVALVAFGD
jgi:molybdopterin/thiamine biosynthesis adenylyltransferase